MINKVLCKYINQKYKAKEISVRQLSKLTGLHPRTLWGFLNQELKDGKPRKITLKNADELLRAVDSDWTQFAYFLAKEKAIAENKILT